MLKMLAFLIYFSPVRQVAVFNYKVYMNHSKNIKARNANIVVELDPGGTREFPAFGPSR